jgi:hypothetical protein
VSVARAPVLDELGASHLAPARRSLCQTQAASLESREETLANEGPNRDARSRANETRPPTRSCHAEAAHTATARRGRPLRRATATPGRLRRRDPGVASWTGPDRPTGQALGARRRETMKR